MSSAIDSRKTRSAAWRISLWGTLAFALGSLVMFLVLARSVARDIERRSDVWLTGEVEKLQDVAAVTAAPEQRATFDSEVNELSREVPEKWKPGERSDEVFFLHYAADGALLQWVGEGDGRAVVGAMRGHTRASGFVDVFVPGMRFPFRILGGELKDGSWIALGLSERDQSFVLRKLRLRFLLLWLLNVALGFAIVFWITRRMLRDVRKITAAAARIGEADLSLRVPVSGRVDEAGQLAVTLNGMLDRIERSVRQVRTMTNSLAHDLRSPLTAVRAKLEMALAADMTGGAEGDAIEAAIDEVDRLTEILTRSLDVAEARADALRLEREAVDLDGVLRGMTELYEPSFAEKGLRVELRSSGRVKVFADATLLHRVMANLFDNELKHVPPSCVVRFVLSQEEEFAVLQVEDDGPGFPEEVTERLFEARVKGAESSGRGLGLAFVEAVVVSHGGTIEAGNAGVGGIRMVVRFPLATEPVLVSQ